MKILEKAFICSFCMGGAVLFVIRCLRPAKGVVTGVLEVLGAGGIVYLFLARALQKKCEGSGICLATLAMDHRKVTVPALIDSGNSLAEPISGMPVCVVDEQVFREVWGERERIFRAVPYHSIGKKKGILEGYLLPELVLESDGIQKKIQNVYIAVSPEAISATDQGGEGAVRMIINPRLLEEKS